MHRDHPHCPLPAPAFCSSTTPNATRSGTKKSLPASLARPVLTTSPPTLYHVHTHLTSEVPRGILTPLPLVAHHRSNVHQHRRAHHMRQSLPIPSAPFSASPRAATILAASGSKDSVRRTPDMYLSHFPSPTPIVSTLYVIPSSTQLTYAHFGTIRTTAACAPHSSEIRRRAVRPSSARYRRTHAAGRYPTVGACGHCGHGCARKRL
ncbi:hypothetical protein DFH08DRAFT_247764 [Mycena albidolilacea]|uniref:Uncharacterized protein n=1 Tax=Mycena albidolilacea TaxID=1033008 RepID=A0AAD7EMG2_9AGAR|nr:hypothetical protein DFH08DRAFT_247764 [Mycena albidolilacea]